MSRAAEFTGAAVCGECHPSQFAAQTKSHHAHALRPIHATPLAGQLAQEPLRERSGWVYTYRRAGAGVEVTAAKEGASASMLLEWCFGAGSQGATAVGRVQGEYVEHRVSWYRSGNRRGLTAGHPADAPADARSALGVVQTPENIARCFGCHATAVGKGLDLTAMQPGVNCERCHGPGGDHVAAMRAGQPARGTMVNPHGSAARAQIQLCAQCHRSPNAEFESAMPELEDPISVRFAPVGFQASACFRKSNNFTCVTCHDPHADPLPAADPHYTAVCKKCHANTQRRGSNCRRAVGGNCVECHMKKTRALPNLSFTDHRIRVYLP